MWAALRFGQPGATIATLVASSIAIAGTARGWGPFTQETINSSLVLLQSFMGVAATTGLVLGAVITERKRATEALQESEARYRQLIEIAPDTIAVHSEGRIVFVNPAGVTLLGAPSAAALVGKPILDFVHPDYHALAIERVHQMVDEHKPVDRIEERFVRFDGSVVDVEVVAMALTYQNQPAVQVVVHDITRRKEAEEARRRAEAHFRSLIENSLDLIAVVDSGGVFRYASPSNNRVLGYAPEELVGKNAFAFFHPDDAARIEGVFVDALQHPGDTPWVEFRFRHKNGSWRFIEAIGNNVRDELGGTTVVINSRDITDRKLAEQALAAR